MFFSVPNSLFDLICRLPSPGPEGPEDGPWYTPSDAPVFGSLFDYFGPRPRNTRIYKKSEIHELFVSALLFGPVFQGVTLLVGIDMSFLVVSRFFHVLFGTELSF